MDLRLAQKHSSADIDRIRAQYAPEEERIRNEIEGLDKLEQQDEYQDLLRELNDLKEEKESKIARREDEASDHETIVQSENESLEVRLEDINAEKESFQEMLKQNIEQEFGYFQ
jgi:predicted nuclease with TOPRIM domain